MRVLSATVICQILLCPSLVSAQDHTDQLRRRADLGAVIRPPAASAPARLVRVMGGSPLPTAGLRAGDNVTALGGKAFADAVDFNRRIAALRGGDNVQFQVSRDGQPLTVAARVTGMAREQLPATDVVYTQIANPRGPRQRAIITRP